MTTAKLILTVSIVLLPPYPTGQELLTPIRPVSGSVNTGASAKAYVTLNDGDYVEASVVQEGKVNVTVLNPDGSIGRRFSGPAKQGKIAVTFAAEGSGRYSIQVANPGDQSVSYRIVIDKVVSLTDRLAPPPWTDTLQSPRIESLRKQISAGNTSTEAFWLEMATQGTPLVEPIDGDAKYFLVTFLWRARHDTRNVLVIATFDTPVHPEDLGMHRVGSSDVWYLTRKLPAGSRFGYSLSPNDPMMAWDDPRAVERSSTRQLDPLNRNPHRMFCQAADVKFGCQSVAELPGAIPQPWLVRRAGTPEGQVKNESIQSTVTVRRRVLDIVRTFSVYTPAGSTPTGRKNALAVLFDGPFWFPNEEFDQRPWMTTTLDELIAARKIPPTVVVFVNNDFNRNIDLIANNAFANFIAKELVPWIRAHYNVTDNAADTVVGGYSAGGLEAALVGLRHSEVFGNVISLSGGFWWAPDHNGGLCRDECEAAGYKPNQSMDALTEPNWMAKQFLASRRLPVRFFLQAGTFELDRRGKGGDILETNRHLRDVLLAKGYEVHYQEVPGAHSGLFWQGGIADALIALLGTR